MKSLNKFFVVVALTVAISLIVFMYFRRESAIKMETNKSNQAFLLSEMPQKAISLAETIGGLRRTPIEKYWDERRIADQEDVKDGYQSNIDYPGRRRTGVVSITNPRWRPDTSKYGPRLKACEAKWRPIIEKNYDIGVKRSKAIKDLRAALVALKNDLTTEEWSFLISNIVERAKLSSAELEEVSK